MTKTYKLQITEGQRLALLSAIASTMRMNAQMRGDLLDGLRHLPEMSVNHPDRVIDIVSFGRDAELEATWSSIQHAPKGWDVIEA